MKRPVGVLDVAVATALLVAAAAFWKLRIIDPATILVGPPSRFANTGNGDFFTQTYPMWHRAARWISAGEIPLWNPFQYGGHPFLATSLYGVLYPINWIAWLFPTAMAIEITNVTHMFVAGTFAYLFGRTIALSRLAAAFMGLTFMLSGFIAAETAWFPPAIASAAWLPLGLIGVEVIFATRSFRGTALLALAVAMPVLAGWIQSWVYALYFIGAYAAARLVGLLAHEETRARAWPIVKLLGAGLVLGLGLAAAQLLPTLELMRLGPRRPGALSVEYMLAVGTTSPHQLLVEMTDPTPGYPRFAYVGILTLLLAPLAIWSGRRQARILCFAGLALGSLAVALTIHTPVFSLYGMVPGAGWFRKPQRILFLYALAAAALAGVGIDALMANRQGASAHRRGLIVLGVVLVASVLMGTGAPPRSWVYLFAGAALSLGIAYGEKSRTRALLVSAMFAVVLCDLAGAARNPYLHPIHGIDSLDRARGVFDFIRARQELQRTYIYAANPFDYALMAKQGTLRGIYSITDYEPLSLSRYEQFFDRIAGSEDRRAKHLTFTGHLDASPSDSRFRSLDLLGVRYIVAPRAAIAFRHAMEAAQRGWRLAPTSADESYVVYERDEALPRAYVAHAVRSAADADEALRAVTTPDFDPRASVVLEADARTGTLTGGGDAPIRAAAIEEYEPRHVVIATSAHEPGYLVLTDTFYPGWKARVDGRPAPILQANYLFRAVPVPAGTHRVTFSYEPASFALGLVVSSATVVLLALGLSGRLRFLSA